MPAPEKIDSQGISAKQVQSVAHLARLSISEDEVRQTTEKLTAIMGLIDEMQAVNTDGIEPLANPLDAVQRLRADEVTETNNREQLMTNAPAKEDGLFLVPKVID
ncbi:Asp-tRNA(Asn)/Glu-tRNA(Gln) amidotransferase subunit GatC [Sansalvadorimonas sp. 2012CJ34-2]|uniref:Aspartyl/glutamyl-tRNA(Asn/Gln) amidotransferase subunit C n=2 Tax=Parendozoicomonas callyspongiae TaxID=2942213 RepID=A0ABT0PC16_9GAMM|nr:Asp-tRNA(Asn)/Glu-tRNA(Gln) amidotransferase subunit GatC [Sansalvadorimonas sp. 2012CJ34-2]MCL6268925.1 Asp-tRNA(Asn)/Glu-tRNA(Gln) amidotransferase subunit GatC [Sansalvadorimonas sp. 2012CJ34-2]